MPDTPQESLLFMLGEMRADLKYLVTERHRQSERLDELEAAHSAKHDMHDARLTKLETFRTKIGLLATGLGVLVPTVITVVAQQLGLLK